MMQHPIDATDHGTQHRMISLRSFLSSLSPDERKLVRSLSSPIKIQHFLDSVAYSTESSYRAPLTVLRERVAHCYDGAVFAAAALAWNDDSPLIVNFFPNSRDDEHLVALFRRNGCWGAIGQSNFVGLRYREPIHRTLRELMISYFEQYYNVAGEKTLRSYTKPLSLRRFDRARWMTDAKGMDLIADHLASMPQVRLLTPVMARTLAKVDPLSYAAGLQGSVADGLFKVEDKEG
jgi:hypothetical protein